MNQKNTCLPHNSHRGRLIVRRSPLHFHKHTCLPHNSHRAVSLMADKVAVLAAALLWIVLPGLANAENTSSEKATPAAETEALPDIKEVIKSVLVSPAYQAILTERRKAITPMEAVIVKYPFVVELPPPLDRTTASTLRSWYRQQGKRLTEASATLPGTTADNALRELAALSPLVENIESQERKTVAAIVKQLVEAASSANLAPSAIRDLAGRVSFPLDPISLKTNDYAASQITRTCVFASAVHETLVDAAKSGQLGAKVFTNAVALKLVDPASQQTTTYKIESIPQAIAFWVLARRDIDRMIDLAHSVFGQYDARVLPLLEAGLKVRGDSAAPFRDAMIAWARENRDSDPELADCISFVMTPGNTTELSEAIAKIQRLSAMGIAANSNSKSPLGTPSAVAPFSPEKARQFQETAARRFNVPIEIQNSVGMKLKLIPDGEFQMGGGDALNEKPVHRVQITEPFYLSIYEVTVAQFRAFIEQTGYKTQAEVAGPLRPKGAMGFVAGKRKWNDDYNWRQPGLMQTADDPVVNVSLHDAQAFMKWLGERESCEYRLPTEAEWEYACRAGGTEICWFGRDSKELRRYAWYSDNAQEHTHPVGQKLPNPFGIYDMYGNVWEWCSDLYSEKYYADSPEVDPQGPSRNLLGERVTRGGSWIDPADSCCSTARGQRISDLSFDHLGFRVARIVTPAAVDTEKTGASPTAQTGTTADAKANDATVSDKTKPPIVTIVKCSPELPAAGQSLRVELSCFASDSKPARLEYAAGDESSWHAILANELVLPDLKAGSLCLRFRAINEQGMVSAVVTRSWEVCPSHPYLNFEEVRKLTGPKKEAASLAYSADGSLVAAGFREKHAPAALVWDARSGDLKRNLGPYAGPIESVVFSPDGSLLYTGDRGGRITAWFLLDNEQNEHSVRNQQRRAPIYFAHHSDGVASLLMIRHGQTLVSASLDGLLRLHTLGESQVKSTAVKASDGDKKRIYCVVADPDEHYLACAGISDRINVWRLGKQLEPVNLDWQHNTPVNGIAFCGRSGILASAADKGELKLWNISRRESVRTLQAGSSTAWCVDASPDGEYLATGSEDGFIRLWCVSDGKLLKKLEGHSGGVLAIRFHPDGKNLASAGRDGSVRIWGQKEGT